jgi:hypothetical protein
MSARCGSLLAAFAVLAFACTGCNPALTAIPTGEWAGRGTYVEYEAHRGPEKKIESRSKSASYATSLKISEGDLYGQRVLFFEILSKRGKLATVEGDETHITLILVKLELVANGPTLYPLVDFQFNPSSSQQVSKEDFDQKSQIASAVCFRHGRGIVLQVNYTMPTSDEPTCFWDTFIFEGATVRKIGRAVQDKGSPPRPGDVTSIDWVEDLHRTR